MSAKFERLLTDGPITLDHIDGPGRDLVIAFSSIGHDPARAPSPEFVGTAIGRGGIGPARRALFVMDESRSWANAPEFLPAIERTVAALHHRRPLGRIGMIGLSMGGFAALAAAQVIRADVVLAFGPQWSVAPKAMPNETRWQDWTSRIRNHRWPHAPLPDPAQTWSCLFHGTLDDAEQAAGFPQLKGVDHLLFPDQTHSSLLPHLKQRGALAGLMDAAMAGDRRRLLRIASSAGGIRRR